MTFEEKLAQYRQAYGIERSKTEGTASVATAPAKVEWADEVTVPEAQKEKVSFEQSVDVPTETLSPFAPGLTNDPQKNQGAYMKALDENTAFTNNFPNMEKLMNEIIAQMEDPEDPMTMEEAQAEFFNRMVSDFLPSFEEQE